jgi:hypothetical protein
MFYEEERIKRLRGLALGIFGSFVFSFSSVLVVSLTSNYTYIGIACMSMGSIILAYFGVKSGYLVTQVLYTVSAGALLAAEASALFIYMDSFTSVLYAVITLLGSILALKGIMDIETLRQQETKKRESQETIKFQSEFA